ncbi:polysaccharide deacetylase family protein [Sphingorhabdus arenilitoris]|uniref:Chitooligosaccharide deacetylase n=1 Tax=Sphingorhabdus arenilitoris TaxID=1490041 RepID=A0ABV8RI48_9SPHN
MVLRKISRLSWTDIVAFNVAAFGALAAFVFFLSQQSPAASMAPAKESAKESAPGASRKRIAISFDDAPRGAGAFLDIQKRPEMLIKALKKGGITQAVFFVNPGRVTPAAAEQGELVNYAAHGHLLANHTATHKPLSQVSAAIFLADIDAAEKWLKPLPGYRPWFRFPRLDEGRRDKAKRDAVRAGLKARGLRNGYVTADGWDWYMEAQTVQAKKAGRKMNMTALRKLYIETHVASANFSDRLAQRLLKRRPVQMLLLHETDLAALYVDDLAAALRADGWEIVPADAVYADPMAQMTPDPEFADGTLLEMLAWERGLSGGRWFPRNNIESAKKLFASRVLGE